MYSKTAYHCCAIRTRMSDLLAGAVNEIGDIGIDWWACSGELAVVVLVVLIALVLRGGVTAALVILEG